MMMMMARPNKGGGEHVAVHRSPAAGERPSNIDARPIRFAANADFKGSKRDVNRAIFMISFCCHRRRRRRGLRKLPQLPVYDPVTLFSAKSIYLSIQPPALVDRFCIAQKGLTCALRVRPPERDNQANRWEAPSDEIHKRMASDVARYILACHLFGVAFYWAC